MAIEDVRATKQQRRALQVYLETGGDMVAAYEQTRAGPCALVSERARDLRAKKWFSTPTMRKLLKEADMQSLVSMERKSQAGIVTALEKYNITKDRIIEELAKIAFASATDVMSWGPDGVVVKESSELGDAGAAVAEVTSSGGGEKSPLHMKIKLLDKRQALLDLGKELGMFTEKVEHKGTVAVAAKFIVEGR